MRSRRSVRRAHLCGNDSNAVAAALAGGGGGNGDCSKAVPIWAIVLA